MARRKLNSPDEKRSSVVGVRFSAAEKAEVERMAKAAGVSPADFARQRILSGRVVVKKESASRLPAPEFREMSRIGSNLAQVLKLLNYAKAREAQQPEKLTLALSELVEPLNTIRVQLAAILAQGGRDELSS